jgi:hypothetical protein
MDKLIIIKHFYDRDNRKVVADDCIDRLNSRVTVFILIMCIFTITSGITFGTPINCWTPGEMEKIDIDM